MLQKVQKVAKKLHSVASVMLSHTSHYMHDQGGCGYNNFEYVSVVRLKGLQFCNLWVFEQIIFIIIPTTPTMDILIARVVFASH